jgi:hypothetical protein
MFEVTRHQQSHLNFKYPTQGSKNSPQTSTMASNAIKSSTLRPLIQQFRGIQPSNVLFRLQHTQALSRQSLLPTSPFHHSTIKHVRPLNPPTQRLCNIASPLSPSKQPNSTLQIQTRRYSNHGPRNEERKDGQTDHKPLTNTQVFEACVLVAGNVLVLTLIADDIEWKRWGWGLRVVAVVWIVLNFMFLKRIGAL